MSDFDDSRLVRFERKLDAIQDTMVRRDDFIRLLERVEQSVPRTEYDSRHSELKAMIERTDTALRAGFDAASLARDAAYGVLERKVDKDVGDHEGRLRGLEASRVPERVFLGAMAIIAALVGAFGNGWIHR